MKKLGTYIWIVSTIGIGWGTIGLLANGTRLLVKGFSVDVHVNLASVADASQIATSSPQIDLSQTTSSTEINNKEIKIFIGGDIMFDRDIRARANIKGYDSILSKVAPIFKSADIAVANLEGPITTFPSHTLLVNNVMTNELIFTFASTTATALKNAGISLVSLANNHSYNFGAEGLMQTKKFLSNSEIDWFGDPNNIPATEKTICMEACFAFVGYHEFTPGFEKILADITRLSQKGYEVIVMPHWGDEYAAVAPSRIRDKARQLVQAGANIIIGSHPHVVEDKEWINNVPVIYSIGNLIFDQYFNQEVKGGLIVELTFDTANNHAELNKILLQKIMNESTSGPILVGQPVEFKL